MEVWKSGMEVDMVGSCQFHTGTVVDRQYGAIPLSLLHLRRINENGMIDTAWVEARVEVELAAAESSYSHNERKQQKKGVTAAGTGRTKGETKGNETQKRKEAEPTIMSDLQDP